MLPPKYDKDHTLELIEMNTECLVFLPWNGDYIPFIMRMLNSTQLRACGDFSVVSVLDKEEEIDVTAEENFESIISLKNTQEKMLEFSMVNPTYEEMLEVLRASKLIESIEQKLAESQKQVDEATDLTKAERIELLNEIEKYRLFLGFLYPDDFIGAFVQFITQKNNTDIGKVSKEILLEAAISAEQWKTRPSDYLEGIFTEYQKNDIDKYATIVLRTFRDQLDVANKTSSKWVRGHRKGKK